MAPRRTRSVARDLTISLLLTIAMVLGAEFGIRRLALKLPFFVIPNAINCLQRSALFGMEYAPNCSGVSGAEGTRFRTNSLGLRDTELVEDGRPRILSM